MIFIKCLCIYRYFISYSFLETNLLKRRFHIIIILQIILKFFTVLFFYLDTIEEIYYGLINILGIILIYDFIKLRPYVNKSICLLYGAFAIIIEFSTILVTIFKFTDILKNGNFLFTLLLPLPLIIGFGS